MTLYQKSYVLVRLLHQKCYLCKSCNHQVFRVIIINVFARPLYHMVNLERKFQRNVHLCSKAKQEECIILLNQNKYAFFKQICSDLLNHNPFQKA